MDSVSLWISYLTAFHLHVIHSCPQCPYHKINYIKCWQSLAMLGKWAMLNLAFTWICRSLLQFDNNEDCALWSVSREDDSGVAIMTYNSGSTATVEHFLWKFLEDSKYRTKSFYSSITFKWILFFYFKIFSNVFVYTKWFRSLSVD